MGLKLAGLAVGKIIGQAIESDNSKAKMDHRYQLLQIPHFT